MVPHAPRCRNTYQPVPTCANLCQHVPTCANMCQHVPLELNTCGKICPTNAACVGLTINRSCAERDNIGNLHRSDRSESYHGSVMEQRNSQPLGFVVFFHDFQFLGCLGYQTLFGLNPIARYWPIDLVESGLHGGSISCFLG